MRFETIVDGTFMMSNTVFRMSLGIALVLPGVALVNVYRLHHTSLVLSHYVHGRAGNCNLTESFEAEALARLLDTHHWLRVRKNVQ